jgi:hypothetical protein
MGIVVNPGGQYRQRHDLETPKPEKEGGKSHSLLRSSFDKEKRQVPCGPDDTENQARNQRVPFVLKAVEGEVAPAEFFTDGSSDPIKLSCYKVAAVCRPEKKEEQSHLFYLMFTRNIINWGD